MRAVAAAIVLAAGLLAGCSLLPNFGTQGGATQIPDDQLPVGVRVVTPPDQLRLHVFDSTTHAVVLDVNGTDRLLAAGDGLDLGVADLGPLPWHVQLSFATGRTPIDVTINPGDDWRERNADGSVEVHAAGGRADLSCGQLRVTTQLTPTTAPGSGTPGDCD
jgi:hypothetical protein